MGYNTGKGGLTIIGSAFRQGEPLFVFERTPFDGLRLPKRDSAARPRGDFVCGNEGLHPLTTTVEGRKSKEGRASIVGASQVQIPNPFSALQV